MTKDELERELWKPRLAHEKIVEGRCRASVWNGPREISFHQCLAEAKVRILGYGFCKFHAKRIEERDERDRLNEEIGGE